MPGRRVLVVVLRAAGALVAVGGPAVLVTVSSRPVLNAPTPYFDVDGDPAIGGPAPVTLVTTPAGVILVVRPIGVVLTRPLVGVVLVVHPIGIVVIRPSVGVVLVADLI